MLVSFAFTVVLLSTNRDRPACLLTHADCPASCSESSEASHIHGDGGWWCVDCIVEPRRQVQEIQPTPVRQLAGADSCVPRQAARLCTACSHMQLAVSTVMYLSCYTFCDNSSNGLQHSTTGT